MMIRSAVMDDIGGIIELAETMRREIVTPFPAIDHERVERQLSLTQAHPDAMMAEVAVGRSGGIAGLITAVMADYAFSFERRAVSDVLYVMPDARGAVMAKRLVARFEKWAARHGARMAWLGVSTGLTPDRTGRLFENFGYRAIGAIYRKELA